MKCISSAEIFNMASPVSILVLKKQVPVLVGVRNACVMCVGAIKALRRGKLKFNKQLLPLCII